MSIQPQLSMGKYSYGNPIILYPDSGARVLIGKFCSIAADVKIFLGGNHRPDWVSTYPFNALFARFRHIDGHPATKGNVVIGNDVWIGHGATIMSGVTIGDGAVVGAFSLVAWDVAPYSIVGGNPAREIRKRFSDSDIERLLKVKWWNWPEERIFEAVPLLQSKNLQAFFKFAECIIGG